MIRRAFWTLIAGTGGVASLGAAGCSETFFDGGSIEPLDAGRGQGGEGGAGSGGAPTTDGSVPLPPAPTKCEGACCPMAASCYSSSAGIDSKGSECLAEADNTVHPTRIQMRQRWLNPTSPAGLTLSVVYQSLNNATQLLTPDCYSSPQALSGNIQLIDFDLATGVSRVGFAKFVKAADVASTIQNGFCMATQSNWVQTPKLGTKVLEMAIPAGDLYTAEEAGYPEGLEGPLPQPWEAKPTIAKRLDEDFDLKAPSKDPKYPTVRHEFLARLAPTGDLGQQGFNGVFFFDEKTGRTHGWGNKTFQVLYDNKPDSVFLVPIREAEIRAQLNHPEAPNCAGVFKANVLDPNTGCAAGTDTTKPDFYPWGGFVDTTPGHSDSTTDGYFLIEELEQIWTSVLSMSLCYLYPDPTKSKTEGWGTADDKRCRAGTKWNPKDPVNGIPRGDWCARTNSPGDDNCHDAYHVLSYHAFAAAKITDETCAAL